MSQKIPFRFSSVAKVLTHGLNFGLWGSLVIFFLLFIIYNLLILPDDLKGLNWFSPFFCFILLFLSIHLLIRQGVYYFKQIKDLYEYENYVVLLIFGIYISITFSGINFLYYLNHKTEYDVATQLEGEVSKSIDNMIVLTSREMQNDLKPLEELLPILEQLKRKKQDKAFFLENNKWGGYTFDILLQPKLPKGSGNYDTLLSIKKNDFSIHLTPVYNFYDSKLEKLKIAEISSYVDEQIKSKKLGTAEAIIANQNLEERVQKKDISVASFPYFLYQFVASTFNADPSYFKPAGTVPRIMALIFAIIKTLYFGTLIGAITKNLSKTIS